jgi:hypothetical protein
MESDHERKLVTLDDIERRHLFQYQEKRYEWHRQLVTLSSGGLTLLVSLQSSYVPELPSGLVLLQMCWSLLAISICSGILLLFGSAQSRLDAVNNLRGLHNNHGEKKAVQLVCETNGAYFRERTVFRLAEHLTVGCFLGALVSLAWFAILNAGQV